MVERDGFNVSEAIDEIVHDPIRGIRESVVQVDVEPFDLTVHSSRPGSVRRLLDSLVAAASWGGGVRSLRISARWQAEERDATVGTLCLAVESQRSFQARLAQRGWHGIERVLLDEVRRTLGLIGSGDLVVRSDDGELACEIRLTEIALAKAVIADHFASETLAQCAG